MAFENVWSIRATDEKLAAVRLSSIVERFCKQKWRQLAIENGWFALFWALSAATLAIITVQLNQLDYPIGSGVLLPLSAVTLTYAYFKAHWQQPDSLDIAIAVDVRLKLKQRLSTAWELRNADLDPALIARLNVNAVNLRYPPPSQPVFPVRTTSWARLVPIAGLALLLVIVLDIDQLQGPQSVVADDVVISEGVRLREFARQMQIRAVRDELPRSALEAESMYRLGLRMESGSLDREQTLYRLQDLSESLADQRRAALADAGMNTVTPVGAFSEEGASADDASRLRALIEQLLQGHLTSGELASLQQESQTLSRMGFDPETLAEALREFESGKRGELEQMMDELSRIEAAIGDAGELGRAMERIEETRESLGDLMVTADEISRQVPASDATPDRDRARAGRGDESSDGKDGPGNLSQRGRGSGDGAIQRQRPQVLDPGSGREEVTVRPDSDLRPGAGFSTQSRILPRASVPQIMIAELNARFDAQMEEVLSNESYPLHQKELIRRYFLQVSRGTTETPEGGAEK